MKPSIRIIMVTVHLTTEFLITKIFLLIFPLFMVISISYNSFVRGLDMDVKCTVYEHSDDQNGNNVDVRILVMPLKENFDYTAEVRPDHNPPTTATAKTDQDGIFWAVAKVPNGEKSELFKVDVYEGDDTSGNLVASGDDDAPCYSIPPFKN